MPVTPHGTAILFINHDWHAGMEPWTGGSKEYSGWGSRLRWILPSSVPKYFSCVQKLSVAAECVCSDPRPRIEMRHGAGSNFLPVIESFAFSLVKGRVFKLC